VLVRFGVFELDTDSGELRKQGRRVKLQDQPFQVLQVLLEQTGKVVTREELQRRIWPSDTFVDFDRGLYNAIKRLREALDDSAESPRFIETMPRRGYRFIATVEGNGPPASQTQTAEITKPVPSRNFRPRILLGLTTTIVILALLGGEILWRRRSQAGTVPQIHSIAVLPLQNLSGDPTQEYFSDGMTDALITGLAQQGLLKVISRTSSMEYKQTKKSLPEIARELGVDGIIEGTVQRSGDRVRITAQLIQASSDKHLWADSYERDLHDVFTLEREVTNDIADQVRVRITTQKQALSPQLRPVNLEALDSYLQGSYHLNKGDMGSRDEELRKAGVLFQRSIDADPRFAPAYVGLAEAHHNLWWPSNEDFGIFKSAAEQAVELAADSSEARTEVALTKWEEWNWYGAEQEYRKAITLNPNYALAHDQLGDCLDAMGRLEEGWKEYELAQELDPANDHLSWALYRRGEYDRAIKLIRATLQTRPDDNVFHFLLSETYAQKEMYNEWVKELAQSLKLAGYPDVARHLQRVFATSGYSGATRFYARALEQAAMKWGYFPGVLAQAYARVGDKDRAFYWLSQGIDHHFKAISDPILEWTKIDPGFVSLRSDPRFTDLVRRMGLPP
jgi:TolB-like protein/DNA-binding winged helix-turn-helix (wHTH) protein/tetratricopeptide (TPR) repeat protein